MENNMKAHNLKYTVAFFLLLSPFGMFAQQQMAMDSISIFELMDAVEKGTSCRIYTTITVPFKVKRAEVKNPTVTLCEMSDRTSVRRRFSATPCR